MLSYPKLVSKNPTSDIGNITQNERLPKYLSLENAKKIQNIFTTNNSKFPLRNNTIILLFLNTGIRLSELINLTIKDVDLTRKEIVVIGKGQKERVVYLNKNCIQQLEEYINYLKETNDILIVKEFLGHSCIESTQIYVHVHNQYLKEAMDKHPLSVFENKKIK